MASKRNKTKQKNKKKPARRAAGSGESHAGTAAAEKKDRVLQARVPVSLYNELVARARRLRVPVSNLVRNILEDSTRMVENIVDRGLEIAQVLGQDISEDELSNVLGWQSVVLNKQVLCSYCGCSMKRGENAFIGVGADSGKTPILCENCRNSL